MGSLLVVTSLVLFFCIHVALWFLLFAKCVCVCVHSSSSSSAWQIQNGALVFVFVSLNRFIHDCVMKVWFFGLLYLLVGLLWWCCTKNWNLCVCVCVVQKIGTCVCVYVAKKNKELTTTITPIIL